METLLSNIPSSTQGLWERSTQFFLNVKHYLLMNIVLITLLFTLIGKALVFFDPAAGILDIGILTVALFGILVGLATILCSLWLQELLWQPFKTFRKHFQSHFNQLTSWQQCIAYFLSFFLMLFACLWALVIVF